MPDNNYSSVGYPRPTGEENKLPQSSENDAVAALAAVPANKTLIVNSEGEIDGEDPLALTDKGDIPVGLGGGSGVAKLTPGVDGTVIESDSTQAKGWKLAVPDGTSTTALARVTGATLAPKVVSVPTVDIPSVATRSFAVGAGPYCVDVDPTGRYVALGCNTSLELRIIDCAVPSTPVLKKTLTTTGAPRRVKWVGSTIWVLGYASSKGYLQAWDAKDPASPVAFSGGTSGVLEVGIEVRGLAVVGDYPIVTDVSSSTTNNFIVIDGTNKTAPVVKGSLALGDFQPWNVCASGYRAYVALENKTVSGSAGAMQVVDISDLSSPAAVTGGASGLVAVPQAPHDLVCDGSTVYVSGYGGGATSRLYRINASDAATPVVEGSVVVAQRPAGIAVLGNVCLVVAYNGDGTGNGCINVVDFTVPTAPVCLETSTITQGQPAAIAIGKNFAAVPQYSSNTFGVFPLVNLLKADAAEFGFTRVQRLGVTGDMQVVGNISGGHAVFKSLSLENPGVFATGASHTVDELIAVLQGLGLMKQA